MNFSLINRYSLMVKLLFHCNWFLKETSQRSFFIKCTRYKQKRKHLSSMCKTTSQTARLSGEHVPALFGRSAVEMPGTSWRRGPWHSSFLPSKSGATVATSHLGREGVQQHVLSLSTSVKFLNALDSFLNKYLLIFQGHVTREENTQKPVSSRLCGGGGVLRGMCGRAEGFPFPSSPNHSSAAAEAIPKHLKTIYKKTEVTTNKDTLSWWFISLVHDVTRH